MPLVGSTEESNRVLLATTAHGPSYPHHPSASRVEASGAHPLLVPPSFDTLLRTLLNSTVASTALCMVPTFPMNPPQTEVKLWTISGYGSWPPEALASQRSLARRQRPNRTIF